MDRPVKRPRLSLFDRSSVGPECDNARYKNDMVLKNRFESIFAKYAQDFTGIGDEVDIISGEVIVNNGHLERMETETDAGIDDLAGGFTSTGRSMLRAMTVTLNPDLPGPDDVLASIETIAENAVMTDDTSATESDDDLFNTSRRTSRSKSTSNTIEQHWIDTSIEPYNSDSDSLFEENTAKSGSPDSLFEKDMTATSEQSLSQDLVEPMAYPAQTLNDDDEILARFGPDVGKEVLTLIGERQDAHIEPAWRIPVKLGQQGIRRSTPYSTSSPLQSESPESRRNKSLWKLPVTTRRKRSQKSTSIQSDSDESVDPLQEDFHGETERGNRGRASEEFEDKNTKAILVQVTNTGICPYCQTNFGNKSNVMAHWDRWLRQLSKGLKEDDPHDSELMRKVRATALSRVRLPRLVVYDFRTIVELHEGAGMTFDEIATSNILRTRKTGLRLQGIYNSHRNPYLYEESSVTPQNWSKAEEETLQEMCKNPLATMATLKRGLKGRDMLEIGNRLAEVWLGQLGVTGGQSKNHLINTTASNADQKAKTYPVKVRVPPLKGASSNSPTLKQEESDDALFER